MIGAKDVHPFKRFVLPVLSIGGVAILVIASIVSHKMSNLYYLAVFAVIMALGAFFHRSEKTGCSLCDKLFGRFYNKNSEQ